MTRAALWLEPWRDPNPTEAESFNKAENDNAANL
jgi:hypothetical protein